MDGSCELRMYLVNDRGELAVSLFGLPGYSAIYIIVSLLRSRAV